MTTIHTHPSLENRIQVFKDRRHAGRILAQMLATVYKDARDLLVLGIPMGGVPVAAEIAGSLNCPMDLIVVRKIQIPGNTEAGFGAMTREGDLFLNEPLMAHLNLTEEEVAAQSARVRRELAERDQALRGSRPLPELEGRRVILVDDGIASGYTMKASIYMAKKRRAAETIVAVPTAPRRSIRDLEGSVDTIFCANVRDVAAFAVAEAYENWHDLSQAEVSALLAD